uniref:PWD n=1 Tax=Arundo donax TaxID=35708 RepID=A0A0A9ERA9_ARUDO
MTSHMTSSKKSSILYKTSFTVVPALRILLLQKPCLLGLPRLLENTAKPLLNNSRYFIAN